MPSTWLLDDQNTLDKICLQNPNLQDRLASCTGFDVQDQCLLSDFFSSSMLYLEIHVYKAKCCRIDTKIGHESSSRGEFTVYRRFKVVIITTIAFVIIILVNIIIIITMMKAITVIKIINRSSSCY